jgi:uncharacterized protein
VDDCAPSHGTVTELHRWPVKSLAGEPADVLRIDGRGVGGDRTHVVLDEFRGRPRVLTAREAPRLLAWRASYEGADVDPAAPPEPVLTAPDGRRLRWSDPALPGALAQDLGRTVALQRDPAGCQDLADSVLVTTVATLQALEGELGQPVDLRRFRTNVHVVLDAPAFAENAWQGRHMTIGEAQLELLHPCERCVIPTRHPDNQVKWAQLLRHLTRAHGGLLGINARPRGAATLHVGDRVAVTGPRASPADAQ